MPTSARICTHPCLPCQSRGGYQPPAYVAFVFFDAGRETRPLQSTPRDGNPFVRVADISPDRGIAFDKGVKRLGCLLHSRKGGLSCLPCQREVASPQSGVGGFFKGNPPVTAYAVTSPFDKGDKDCAHPNRRGGCPHPPAYVAFGFSIRDGKPVPYKARRETATPLSALRTFPLSGKSTLTRGTRG